jgi:hypothetical protein
MTMRGLVEHYWQALRDIRSRRVDRRIEGFDRMVRLLYAPRGRVLELVRLALLQWKRRRRLDNMLSDFTGTYRLSKCGRIVERVGAPHQDVFRSGLVMI